MGAEFFVSWYTKSSKFTDTRKMGGGGLLSWLWNYAIKLTGKMYFHQSIFPVIVDHHKKYTYWTQLAALGEEKKPSK